MSSASQNPSETPPSRATVRIADGVKRLFDVRRGELKLVVVAFAVLLLTISAHTMLETARDALLLAKMPRRALGLVYVVIAILTLPTGAIASVLGERMGPKRALCGSLVAAALLVLGVRSLPASSTTAMILYVLTGLIGAVLVPQFWAFTTGLFTVAQGRRLLGPIASAGVTGGLVGSSVAAAVVLVLPTRQLLFVASAIFLAAALVLFFSKAEKSADEAPPKEKTNRDSMVSRAAMRELAHDPFVARIAGLVFLSTAAVLAVDYLFKWSVAETVPAKDLGPFLARYYMILNGISLVMQLFVGGALVRRLGVTMAAMVTPTLLSTAALAMVLTGGSPAAVLAAKGTDGALRHSVHRITTELVYLPVPIETRTRVKPFIDGALARFAQALTACLFLALAEAGILTRGVMIAIVALLCVAWLVLAANTRGPYLAVFRKALARDASFDAATSDALDFATVEMLVERLASPNPDVVIAAVRVLERRGRQRVIPAILLYHPSPVVLTYALGMFGSSDRTDFLAIAEPLVNHENEGVRMAALRALSRRGRVELLERIAEKEGPRIRGYVTVFIELREAEETGRAVQLARIEALLGNEEGSSTDHEALREGVLAAIADAPKHEALAELVLQLWSEPRRDESERTGTYGPDLLEETTRANLLARAASSQGDARLADVMVEHLTTRLGREDMRSALASLGEPAFATVMRFLQDPATPRNLRVHLPRTLAHFGTPRAAEALLATIETERDGLVRYKAIRGLGKIVADHGVSVDRARVEDVAVANLREHLRLVGLSVGLAKDSRSTIVGDRRRSETTKRFLAGLLADKARQSLERAFRLLKIAHPREDIHSVHRAALSADKRARANASEFLDTLLIRRHERLLRELLRLVTDDLDAEDRVSRAVELVPVEAPRTYEDAIVALAGDGDTYLSRIACEHAKAMGEPTLHAAAKEAAANRGRPARDSVDIPAGLFGITINAV